jgi:hypothetical protein
MLWDFLGKIWPMDRGDRLGVELVTDAEGQLAVKICVGGRTNDVIEGARRIPSAWCMNEMFLACALALPTRK